MTGSGKESEVIIAIGDSTLITWKGEIGLSPLLSKGEVHVKKMNLADFDIYYDLVTDKLDLESGWFSAKFTYDFSEFINLFNSKFNFKLFKIIKIRFKYILLIKFYLKLIILLL